MGACIALAWLALVPSNAHAADEGIWSPFIPSGLPSSSGALAATDPIHDTIYLFGPNRTSAYGANNNETYLLDLAAVPPRLEKLSTVGPRPVPRYGAALVLDPLRRRLLLIGGGSFQASMTEAEVWELTLDDPPRWSKLEPLGPVPGPRLFSVAVYDPLRDRVILYGGARRDGTIDFALSDAWALALSPVPTWSKLEPAGAEPPARAGAAGVYDSRRDRLLIFGGGSDSFIYNDPSRDLWALSLSGTPTWSLEPTGASPPFDGSGGPWGAAYDSTSDQMVVVRSALSFTAEDSTLAVWALPFTAGGRWNRLETTGADPGARDRPAVALSGRRLVAIGGSSERSFVTGPQADAHALDLDSRTWTDLAPIGSSPSPELARIGADAALDSSGSRAFFLGGSPPELWILRLDPTAVWQRPIVGGEKPAAAGMALAWDAADHRLLAVDFSAAPSAEVWSLAPDPQPTWSRLETASPGPPTRSLASIAFDARRHRLLAFGGLGAAKYGDLWQLRLDGVPTWDTLPPLSPLYGAKLVCDESRDLLVLFGGYTIQSPCLICLPIWETGVAVRPLGADDAPWESVSPSGSAPGDLSAFVRDAARDRILSTSGGPLWSLTLGSNPAWTQLQPTFSSGNFIAQRPAVFDAARDRLLCALPGRDLDGGFLRFGAPSAPQIICPGDGSWSAGSIRDVSFAVVDRAGLSKAYEYTLTCERDWPGFPIRGLAPSSAFSTEYTSIGIPIPDTAAFGVVTFGVSTRSREQAGLEANCSFQLDGTPAPVVALGSDAQPDRVVVSWRTSRPRLTVTIARRAESGPWTPLTRQAPEVPGVISYEDASVETDRRYYYRAEISEPASAGAYGQIRVDVPQWALGFAADQPNPVRGRFTIQCAVPAAGRADVDVFDLSGRRAFASSRSASGPGRLSFDVEGSGRLSPGVYFVRLTQGHQARRKTIVFLR